MREPTAEPVREGVEQAEVVQSLRDLEAFLGKAAKVYAAFESAEPDTDVSLLLPRSIVAVLQGAAGRSGSEIGTAFLAAAEYERAERERQSDAMERAAGIYQVARRQTEHEQVAPADFMHAVFRVPAGSTLHAHILEAETIGGDFGVSAGGVITAVTLAVRHHMTTGSVLAAGVRGDIAPAAAVINRAAGESASCAEDLDRHLEQALTQRSTGSQVVQVEGLLLPASFYAVLDVVARRRRTGTSHVLRAVLGLEPRVDFVNGLLSIRCARSITAELRGGRRDAFTARDVQVDFGMHRDAVRLCRGFDLELSAWYAAQMSAALDVTVGDEVALQA